MMESICDACGKKEKARWNGQNWVKPMYWYQRMDAKGCQLVCSRECIEKIAEKTGKPKFISPI